MPKPSFFIIGAPKCGTTTLYHWLKEHDDIFMPETKEPHYFAQHLSDRYCRVRDEASYLNYFSDAKNHQTCGEASVLYSFYPESIKSILKFNSDAKFIFMIRNPVSMVPSYHRQLINNLEEDIEDFETAWNTQNNREISKNSTDVDLLNYAEKGAIGKHLKNLKELIPESQLLILFLEDMQANPKKIYKDTLSFLNIKSDSRTSFKKENQAATTHSYHLQKLMNNPPKWLRSISQFFRKLNLPFGKFIRQLNRKKASQNSLSDELIKQLKSHYKEDIKLIEKLTSRDLSHWRKT